MRRPSFATWFLVALVGGFLWIADAVTQSSSEPAPGSSFVCPVTAPNEKTYTEAELAPLRGRLGWLTTTNPDGTQVTVEAPGGKLGNYGNDALATGLWQDGIVVAFVQADGSLGMKFWWWRLAPGKLVIEGRRLDATAPPLRAIIPDGYGKIGFQATGLFFPSPGCWEVTGRVGEKSLSFVTLVRERG